MSDSPGCTKLARKEEEEEEKVEICSRTEPRDESATSPPISEYADECVCKGRYKEEEDSHGDVQAGEILVDHARPKKTVAKYSPSLMDETDSALDRLEAQPQSHIESESGMDPPTNSTSERPTQTRHRTRPRTTITPGAFRVEGPEFSGDSTTSFSEPPHSNDGDQDPALPDTFSAVLAPKPLPTAEPLVPPAPNCWSRRRNRYLVGAAIVLILTAIALAVALTVPRKRTAASTTSTLAPTLPVTTASPAVPTTSLPTLPGMWVPLGQDLEGINPGDKLGFSVALSADGTVLAVGSPHSSGIGTYPGYVQTWQLMQDTWIPLGPQIEGEHQHDRSGHSIALSADGTVLAIGAWGNDDNLVSSGHVRVWQRREAGGTTWAQWGQDMSGEHRWEHFGSSVSLSANGSILAIGGPADLSTSTGHVRVMQIRDGNNWTQLGQDIYGESYPYYYDYDDLGHSISLSADGTTLAIGAPKFNDVRVWHLVEGTWTRLGQDIVGENERDFSGESVALSTSGNILAIGAPENSGSAGRSTGHVLVWKLEEGQWLQLGQEIVGLHENEYSGFSVALSANATILAIGSIEKRQSLTEEGSPGRVRIFELLESEWIQRGMDLIGKSEWDYYGHAVSLSADGTVVAVGATQTEKDEGSHPGYVQVYQLRTDVPEMEPTTPSPTPITTAQEAPLNDLCENAYALTSDGSWVNGSTSAASIDSNVSSCGYPIMAPGVWFSVIGIGGTLVGSTCGSSFDTRLSVYSGPCENLICVTDNDDSCGLQSQVVWESVSGRMYYLRVHGYDTGEFRVTVVREYATSNELCHNAYSLPSNGTWVEGSTANATVASIAPSCGADIAGPGVWFSVIGIGGTLVGSTCGSSFDTRLSVYSGPCENLICVTDNDDSCGLQSQVVWESVSGQMYYFLVHGFSNNSGDFCLSAVESDDPTPVPTSAPSIPGSWVQLGQDIIGEAAGDSAGSSVSLSANGSVLAIGAEYNSGSSGDMAGHVRVWRFAEGNWMQLGQDIDGEHAGDFSGSVSLSADGSILAVGADSNGDNGELSGHVRVWRFVEDSWTQLGQDIDGENAYDRSGTSVSLSADGDIVAIGRGSGYTEPVGVWQFKNSSWTQLGDDIDGAGTSDSSSSVSLSADGNIVAFGDPDYYGSSPGHVRVWQFTGNRWTQLGQELVGEDDDDNSGWSVSLSADGNVLAIGARYNDGNSRFTGHVRVWQLIDSKWIRVGQDIDGKEEFDNSGWSVSMSADGSVLAIGDLGDTDNGATSGKVRIFQLVENQWRQLGSDILGKGSEDSFGWSVSLSDDGTVVAVGTKQDTGFAGYVQVYQLQQL